jgi:hypothetical protein
MDDYLMTYNEVLLKFGLPAHPQFRDEIRQLLMEEIVLARESKDREEMLRLLTVQLFSIGNVEDSLIIWAAKRSNFDASIIVDIEAVCGAGLAETKAYLARINDSSAKEALEYLIGCEQGGQFTGWKSQSTIDA